MKMKMETKDFCIEEGEQVDLKNGRRW